MILVSLLRRKNAPAPTPQQTPQEPLVETVPPAAGRILLLVPEGAYLYQLVAVPDTAAATAYADLCLVPGQSFIAFRAVAPDVAAGREGHGEALVLVPDSTRREIVQPYSFADLNAARHFIERELPGGHGAHFFWGEPVDVPTGITPRPAVAVPPPRPASSHGSGGAALQPAMVGAAAATATIDASAAGQSGSVSRLVGWPGWDGLGQLVVGAAMGKREVYDAAIDEEDGLAERRALLIVVLGAIAAAVGGLGSGGTAPAIHFLSAITGWAVAASVIYLVGMIAVPGRRPERAGKRVLTALGLSYSPAMLLFLGALPIFGPLFLLGILMWIAGTTVVAVMTSLELEVEQAVIVASTGWVGLFALTLVVPAVVA